MCGLQRRTGRVLAGHHNQHRHTVATLERLDFTVAQLPDYGVLRAVQAGKREHDAHITDLRMEDIVAVIVEARMQFDGGIFRSSVRRYVQPVDDFLLDAVAQLVAADRHVPGDLGARRDRYGFRILVTHAHVEAGRIDDGVAPFGAVVVGRMGFRLHDVDGRAEDVLAMENIRVYI